MDTPANFRLSLFGRGTLVRVAGDPARWVEAAIALPNVRHVALQDGALALTLDDPDAQNPDVLRALVAAGAPVRYVEPLSRSLEDVYLQLVHADEAATTALAAEKR